MPPAKKTPRASSGSPEPASGEPELAVSLNLDTLDREDAPEPFTFLHQGKRYSLGDPQEIDWQKLIAAMSNPFMFLRLTLPAEQADEFITAPMPTWKMNALMEQFREHYGLPGAGDLAALPR